MKSYHLVNTGSSHGLLPDSTKPLPEPMLTYHQCDPVTFTQGNFIQNSEDITHCNLLESYVLRNYCHISQGPKS